MVDEPLVPSAPSEESKRSSAELVLADAIAQGLHRHRNAAGNEATAINKPAKPAIFSSPDIVTSFDLPDAPARDETSVLRTHFPAAPSLVPLVADKPVAEQPVGGRASEVLGAANVGVLFVNLGAPVAAKSSVILRFLKEAFSDPRVIENGSSFWKPTFFRKMAVNCLVLPVRAWRGVPSYRKIWNQDKHELPLTTITRSQAEKLTGIFEPLGKHLIVDWAMRYAEPSIATRLSALIASGCDRILVVPLYPQCSSLTTATICDEVCRFFIGLNRQPALRIMRAYYDDPHYIELLASSLKAGLKKFSFEPDVILASYPDISKKYLRSGDPYASQCATTIQLLRNYLKVDEKKLMMTYHSRFGHASWLEPATIKTVKALAKRGVKSLAVVLPGFSGDGLETLQQVTLEAARVFKRNGGENFAAVPSLNDSEQGILLITRLAMRELESWV